MLQIEDTTLFTLEPAWLNNQANISCIPTGVYLVRWEDRPKHGRVLALVYVPNREDILIHVGNYPKDTEGCILVGRGVTDTEPALDLLDSREALEVLADLLQVPQAMYLEITNDTLGGQSRR
jgi:hypothetical protein